MESNMTKRFKINHDLTCPELAGYKLPEQHTPRTPVAIEVEMVESPAYNAIRMQDKNDCFAYFIPTTNPDGTVKGVYIYE